MHTLWASCSSCTGVVVVVVAFDSFVESVFDLPEVVVHYGVLYERCKYEDEASEQVDVDGLDVGEARQWCSGTGEDGSHCQHCGDSWNTESALAAMPKT